MAKVPDETADGVVPADVDLTDDSDVGDRKRVVRSTPPPEIQGGTVIPMAETGPFHARSARPFARRWAV